MMPNWIYTKLGNVAILQNGYAFKSKVFNSTGIPILKIKNIVPPKIILENIVYFNEEISDSLIKYMVSYGDILISMTGSTVNQMSSAVGKIGRYKYDFPALLNQRVGKIILTDKKITNYNYLYYFISRPEIQYLLALNATGSANQANISPDQIMDIDILLPPLPEQHRIAEILGALDDKIELNLEINKTLEEMAMAIYKEWFVDFGPFRDGEFVDSELGSIPQGWEVIKIGQLFDYVIGGDWGKEKQELDFSVESKIIRGTDIQTLELGGIHGIPNRFLKESNFNKRRLIDGDLIIEISGGSTGQPTGRSLYITQNYLERLNCKAVPASFCRLLRPINQFIGSILAVHLKYLYKTGGTWFYQNQSTGISNFQFNFFSEKELIPIPRDEQILERFFRLIRPLYEQISSNENMCLTEIRDFLLPKLISGEIRVKAAEKKLKEVL